MRTEAGVQLLFEYYNQVYFLERRFFSPEKSLNLFFEWYVDMICLGFYSILVSSKK